MSKENLDKVMEELEEMTKDFEEEETDTQDDINESKEVQNEETAQKTSKENQETNREETSEQEKNEQASGQNQEILQLKDTVARLQADFQNYRNRTEKEKSSIYKMANEGLILKVLPVLDNLDRALQAEKEHDAFFQGVTMIRDELVNVLKAEGLESFDPAGEKFDANMHHAVLMEESDQHDSEHVIETFQAGYKLKDKIIRPAMVKVAK